MNRYSVCLVSSLLVFMLGGCFQANGKERLIQVSSANESIYSGDTLPWPTKFGLGRPATQAEIALLDIDVRPDGKGLPAGEGKSVVGKVIFASKCAACHGVGGIGGPNGSLVSTPDVAKKRPEKTIGTYWPYATTVFDYIRRAMPFNEPGSLTNDEVYHLTTYLLNANGIINEAAIMNARTLPNVVMPAKKLFVPDDRTGGPTIR